MILLIDFEVFLRQLTIFHYHETPDAMGKTSKDLQKYFVVTLQFDKFIDVSNIAVICTKGAQLYN